MVTEHQFSLFNRTIEERFASFHAAHPEVYTELVALARDAKAAGQRVGIRACWERLRWMLFIERQPGDYKLNDQYTSRYARLICEREPDLREMFELRELRAL